MTELPPDEIRRIRAIDAVSRRARELDLARQAAEGQSFEYAQECFLRWAESMHQTLVEYISEEEAERFEAVTGLHTYVTGDEYVQAYSHYLEVLLKTLQTNPEQLLRVRRSQSIKDRSTITPQPINPQPTLKDRFQHWWTNHPVIFPLVVVFMVGVAIAGGVTTIRKAFENSKDQKGNSSSGSSTATGIPITGGGVNNPTVNNSGTPPPPDIRTSPSEAEKKRELRTPSSPSDSIHAKVTDSPRPKVCEIKDASVFHTASDLPEQIRIWRSMISQVANACPRESGFGDQEVSAAIQRHADFQSLRPRLSGYAQAQLSRTTHFFAGAQIQSVLIILQDEVDRIEQESKDSHTVKR